MPTFFSMPSANFLIVLFGFASYITILDATFSMPSITLSSLPAKCDTLHVVAGLRVEDYVKYFPYLLVGNISQHSDFIQILINLLKHNLIMTAKQANQAYYFEKPISLGLDNKVPVIFVAGSQLTILSKIGDDEFILSYTGSETTLYVKGRLQMEVRLKGGKDGDIEEAKTPYARFSVLVKRFDHEYKNLSDLLNQKAASDRQNQDAYSVNLEGFKEVLNDITKTYSNSNFDDRCDPALTALLRDKNLKQLREKRALDLPELLRSKSKVPKTTAKCVNL